MTKISKWYCDLTTEEGSAIIGYWARLEWGPFRLSCASYLLSRPGQALVTREILWGSPEPVNDNGVMTWSCPRLGLQGQWRTRELPISLRLLENSQGVVDWHCLMPEAQAQLTIDGVTWTGQGYVERLSMTVVPWRLPFAQLRWGRALAPGRHCVWIDWLGGEERSWTILNGRLVRAAYCNDEALMLADGRHVALKQHRTLRDGTIGEVIQNIPLLGQLIPGRLRNARETKWLSHALWSDGLEGPAIHEVIRWA